MLARAIGHFDEYDRRIFWILAGICAASLILYVYFLSISISSVVERKRAERSSSELVGSVAMLESRYVELDKRVTLTFAHEKGFHDIGVPTYVSSEKKPDTLTLAAP